MLKYSQKIISYGVIFSCYTIAIIFPQVATQGFAHGYQPRM